jgi:hypothetical protein
MGSVRWRQALTYIRVECGIQHTKLSVKHVIPLIAEPLADDHLDASSLLLRRRSASVQGVEMRFCPMVDSRRHLLLAKHLVS